MDSKDQSIAMPRTLSFPQTLACWRAYLQHMFKGSAAQGNGTGLLLYIAGTGNFHYTSTPHVFTSSIS
jgi:hypothetical protein